MHINKEVQKLRQKSQSNISDINFGESAINESRKPILSINNIEKAESMDTNIMPMQKFTKCIVDITPLLLK